jgi:hypothetical protein
MKEQIQEFLAVYKELLTKKITKGIASLEKHEATIAVAPLDAVGKFQFDFSKCGGLTDCALEGKRFAPLLHVQKNFAYAAPLDERPFAGLGGVLTVVQGMLVVTLATVDNIVHHQASLDQVQVYLDKISDANSLKLPMVNLPEGRSLYIPFGYVPLCVGVSNEFSKTEFVAFTFHALFDVQQAKASEPASLSEVKGSLTKGMSRSDSKVFSKDACAILNHFMSEWSP